MRIAVPDCLDSRSACYVLHGLQLSQRGSPFHKDLSIATDCLQADNPGLWILHCHTDWHLFMGQKMYFATSPETAPAPPSDLPQCPSACMYNFGAFTPEYVQNRWGASGYPI